MKLKVLVADDSVLFRRAITDVLNSIPDIEVVGNASNGRLALQKIRELKPDVVTLDVEMPEMDGIAVLDALKQAGETVSVIMVSAVTKRGGQLTLKALEKGAFDFITKPESAHADMSRDALRSELSIRLQALSRKLEIRTILRGKPAAPPAQTPQSTQSPAPQSRPAAQGLDDISARMSRISGSGKPEMILIGVSTGGPNALAAMMPSIPSTIGVPVLIVQHMPPVFTQTLAESLDVKCAIRVSEAVHGQKAEPNRAYIAPGGRHMRIQQGTDGSRLIQLTDDPPENNCRPSVDYLFRSAANSFPGRAMAVILTGMGNDGTLGLRLLKRHGCYVIAQDEASCVVYGMPKAAVEAGVVDSVLPLETIAGEISAAIRRLRA